MGYKYHDSPAKRSENLALMTRIQKALAKMYVPTSAINGLSCIFLEKIKYLDHNTPPAL